MSRWPFRLPLAVTLFSSSCSTTSSYCGGRGGRGVGGPAAAERRQRRGGGRGAGGLDRSAAPPPGGAPRPARAGPAGAAPCPPQRAGPAHPPGSGRACSACRVPSTPCSRPWNAQGLSTLGGSLAASERSRRRLRSPLPSGFAAAWAQGRADCAGGDAGLQEGRRQGASGRAGAAARGGGHLVHPRSCFVCCGTSQWHGTNQTTGG